MKQISEVLGEIGCVNVVGNDEVSGPALALIAQDECPPPPPRLDDENDLAALYCRLIGLVKVVECVS